MDASATADETANTLASAPPSTKGGEARTGVHAKSVWWRPALQTRACILLQGEFRSVVNASKAPFSAHEGLKQEVSDAAAIIIAGGRWAWQVRRNGLHRRLDHTAESRSEALCKQGSVQRPWAQTRGVRCCCNHHCGERQERSCARVGGASAMETYLRREQASVGIDRARWSLDACVAYVRASCRRGGTCCCCVFLDPLQRQRRAQHGHRTRHGHEGVPTRLLLGGATSRYSY